MDQEPETLRRRGAQSQRKLLSNWQSTVCSKLETRSDPADALVDEAHGGGFVSSVRLG